MEENNTPIVDEPIVNAPADKAPACEPEAKKCQCRCKCLSNPTHCLMACNIVLFIGLVLLYIFHFAGVGTHSKYNPEATEPMTIGANGELKVACVDSDTLLAKYQYAIDLQEELNRYKDAQEKNYQQQMTKFQTDYQNYLKTGENMTLSQQQKTEADLKARAEKLSTLEQELAGKVMQKQMDSNIELLNRIFAYVREYNAENQQFDIILRKTFTDSPTMYINPAMDITDEIVEGLNKEYKEVKGKKSQTK